MPDQFVLGVDLDGVVADHTRRFREIVAELRGVDPESLPMDRSWDFSEWGFAPDEYNRLHKLAVTEYDMIRTMPVIEGAADALWRLSDAGDLAAHHHPPAVRQLGPRTGGRRHRGVARRASHPVPRPLLPRRQAGGPGRCLHRRRAAQRHRPARARQHGDRVRSALQPPPRRRTAGRRTGRKRSRSSPTWRPSTSARSPCSCPGIDAGSDRLEQRRKAE